jgi:hypothetical protein
MSIFYKYLDEGTDFSAAEFNDRFEALMGFETGVNALNPESFALGAFRQNHLPSLVGPSGHAESDLIGGFTAGTSRLFLRDSLLGSHAVSINERATVGALASGDPVSDPLFQLRLNPSVHFDSASDSHVNALIILANIHVNRFIRKGSQITANQFKEAMRERALGIVFTIHLDLRRVSGSTVSHEWVPIPNSQRMVSPGFTMDYNSSTMVDSGYPMNYSGEYDYRTNKDVALRAVVTKEQIREYATGFDEFSVNGVAVTGCLVGDGANNVKGRVDKGNLTVIPLHTKVLDVVS